MKEKKSKSKAPKEKTKTCKLDNTFLKIVLLAIGILVAIAIIVLIIFNLFVDNEKYNITFNTNGGSSVNSIVVDEKDLLKKPKEPTKEGSIFAGWYYEDKLYDFDIPVTKDMTLEAKWEEVIKVTGIKINKTRLNLYPNDTLQLKATITPSDANNKNVFWKSSNKDVVEVDSDGNIRALKQGEATITAITEDGNYTSSVTFTVENKVVKYSVTFRDSGKILKTDYVNPGQKITKIQNLTKEGHKFVGWFVDGKEYNFNDTVNKNLILDAKWEKNTYDITFKNYDGSILEVVAFKYGDTPIFDATPLIPGNEKYSYEFAGWSPDLEKVTKDAVYQATYKKVLNKYKVTFVDGNETLCEETVEYGKQAIKIVDPIKEGYKFIGWYLGNSEYSFKEEVTENLELTAKWEKSKYTVTFINDEKVVDTKTIEHGEQVEEIERLTKEGYKFIGWYVEDSKYNFENPVIENLELIAKWEKNKYTVTFINDEKVMDTKTVEHGEKVEEIERLTKEGYKFIGWYVEDSKYNFENSVIENLELIAKWEKNKYTVTFINDEKVVDTKTVEHGEKVAEIKTPTKEGYKFIGWYVEGKKYNFNNSVIGNLELTAKWEKNKYEITFKNEDGSMLEVVTASYGDTPKYSGSIPVKESDAQYSYEFAGWSPSIVEATENATYTATYNNIINSYKVIFVDEDNILSEETVEYGKTVTKIDDPTKEGHKFIGWYVEEFEYNFEEPVTKNLEIIAKWEKNKYEITFKNEAGSTLEVVTVSYGDTPKYSGNTPTKESDQQYTYEFAGWSPSIVEATENAIYTATYKNNIKYYTVQFVDGDSVINGLSLEYGKVVTKIDDPVKGGYKFIGWYLGNSEYTFKEPLTGDLILTAKWEKNKYTVTFINDEKVVDTKTVEHGEKVAEIKTPTREGYKFLGWYVEDSKYNFENPVVGNLELIAKWEKEKYNITFKNYDGSILETVTVEYGTTPKYSGSIPVKESDAQYTYEFAGWSPRIEEATKSIIYTATYKNVINSYKVTFVDEDSILNEETVEYGKTVTKIDTPTKEGHKFIGWYVEDYEYNFEEPVTKNLEIKAKWEKNKYTVTFTNEEQIIATTTVEYGEKVEKIDNPIKENYTFLGWFVNDTKYDFDTPVTKDLDLISKWEKNKYEITFKNYDSSILEVITALHGDMPKVNAIPTRESNAQYTYEFAGWSPSIVEATKPTTYTATYNSIINSYKVTFVDGNNILSEKMVEYGKTVAKIDNPTKEGHKFLGWIVDGVEYNFESPITGDLKLVAKWEKNKYEITFKNDDGTTLDTITFEYGDMPKYDKIPEKKPVSVYKFMGWSPSLEKVTEDKTYTATYKYLADVDTRIERRLDSFSSSKFHIDKNANNLHVTFTSYTTTNIYGDTVVKEPPFKFTDLFFEVVDFFHIISNEGYYESFEMYYKHEGDSKGKTLDLKDYDLTDKSFSSWYGSGANDYVGDWIGYLATGTASTTAAYGADSGDLEGKTVTVTIRLIDGYVLDNGQNTVIYYLNF